MKMVMFHGGGAVGGGMGMENGLCFKGDSFIFKTSPTKGGQSVADEGGGGRGSATVIQNYAATIFNNFTP